MNPKKSLESAPRGLSLHQSDNRNVLLSSFYESLAIGGHTSATHFLGCHRVSVPLFRGAWLQSPKVFTIQNLKPYKRL
jgi:hypothetical protein